MRWYNFLLSLALWFLIGILTSPLWAQEQPTPQVRALSQRVMVEMQTSLNCSVSVIDLQDRLAKAEAELKALRDKPEAPLTK